MYSLIPIWLSTVNPAAFEVAPPGFWTVMGYVPATLVTDDGNSAVRAFALRKLVKTGDPFTRTDEPTSKFMPVIVIVASPLPAITPSGQIDAIAGSVVVKGTPLTRAPGEKRAPPLPLAVE
jgi:hypothetical protein